MLYYIIELEDKSKNRRVAYIADNYTIRDTPILKIKSIDFGNFTMPIEPHDHITITPVETTTNRNEL